MFLKVFSSTGVLIRDALTPGLILLFLAAAGPLAHGAQSAARESDLKATFLFNFSQFVEWPVRAGAENETFVIGILGRDPFGRFLDDLVKNESAQGRHIEVRRYSNVNQISAARILFVARSEEWRLGHILERLGTQPILTVGESRSFAYRGGMIALVTESEKIRVKINLEAAQACQLTINSKLLRLAEIVRTEPQ